MRILVALPLACLFAVAMFTFMAWLVLPPDESETLSQSGLRFSVMQTASSSGPQAPQARQLPSPPQRSSLATELSSLHEAVIPSPITADNQQEVSEVMPSALNLDSGDVHVTPSVKPKPVQAPPKKNKQTTVDPRNVQPEAIDESARSVSESTAQVSQPSEIDAVIEQTSDSDAPAPTETGESDSLASSSDEDGGGETIGLVPLHRVEPKYPTKAVRRGIEGYVLLRFTIDEQGKPRDIEVVDAEPARVFEREAQRAVKRWRYEPQLLNGVATAKAGQTVRLEFKIRN